MIEEINSDDVTCATSQRADSSPRTAGSFKSTTSSAAILARAKALSLKTKMDFTHKEADLRRQEAELRRQEEEVARSLLILGAEKEYAMAEVEAEFLESAALKEHSLYTQENLQLPTADSAVRTHDYVSKHFLRGNELEKTETKCDMSNVQRPQIAAEAVTDVELKSNKEDTKVTQVPGKVDQTTEFPNEAMKEQLNSISNMLVQKELVKSSLRKFRCNAGEYRAWKGSFKQATKDLDLKPFQEMNLILDSIEGETKSLVQKIYAIHVNKPDLGLQRVWSYLDEKHGSPEAIEHDLMMRVELFQKILPRASTKLEEFGYLLLEVQYVKESKQYPGLLVLDSSRGLQPLVQKLPEWLQMKWRQKGSQYKERHAVMFPPFEVFVAFVQGHARVQNDPSFQFTDVVKSSGDRTPQKSAFTVRKTGVMDTPSVDETPCCPIHNTPHALKDCRVFKDISPEEKITVLRENYMCFRCLQPNHQIKDCKSKVNCNICGKGHLNVMHRPVLSRELTSFLISQTASATGESDEQLQTLAARQ